MHHIVYVDLKGQDFTVKITQFILADKSVIIWERLPIWLRPPWCPWLSPDPPVDPPRLHNYWIWFSSDTAKGLPQTWTIFLSDPAWFVSSQLSLDSELVLLMNILKSWTVTFSLPENFPKTFQTFSVPKYKLYILNKTNRTIIIRKTIITVWLILCGLAPGIGAWQYHNNIIIVNMTFWFWYMIFFSCHIFHNTKLDCVN